MAKNTKFWKLRAGKAVIHFFEKFLFFSLCKAFGVKLKNKPYSVQIPENFYSPWLADSAFKEIKKEIRNHTFLDDYKLFEIWKAVEQVKHLEGDMIEIGVWRGGSGALIAKKCELEKIPSKIFLCDTFCGLVKSSEKDSSYSGGEHADTSVDLVKNLVKKMGLHNTEVLVGIFPEESSQPINNNRFRFCHIDVDIYQSAKDTFDWIWKRLVPGGIVIFDDYGGLLTDGVTTMVNEVAHKSDRVFIHNLNGHAVFVKLNASQPSLQS